MDLNDRELVGVSPLGWPAEEAALADDAPQWLAWKEARQAWLVSKGRVNTIKAYRIAFRQFFEWAGAPPWKVSPWLAQAWVRHMAGKGLAARTINLKLSAMASFYDFVGHRYRPQPPGSVPRPAPGAGPPLENGRELALWPAERPNPFRAVERPRVPAYRRARSPTPEEARAILAAINTGCLTGKRDFALLVTILVSGRPASEVLPMKWGDLERLEDGNCAFSYRVRAGQTRQGTMNHTCYQAICAYLEMDGRPPRTMEPEDTIFVPMDPERIRRLPGHAARAIEPDRPLSSSFASRILKKYARRAGVDPGKARLHGLRRAAQARNRISGLS